ncbi:rhomboid protease N-terminal domain-containing protein [Microbulbifer taiwanensis]|uniref:rhomboid protease N-terminal domain-containing protein n=1 Tax=Microbulbifer taiwanensis TaxID=986746 RepID=UPI003617C73F
MSRWIAVYQFPLDKDLSELALFIRRHRLPLRLAEEGNRQVLATPDPQLGEFLLPLLERWEAGEIDLARVHLEPVETEGAAKGEDASATAETAPAESGEGGESKADDEIAVPSPLPSWPWRKTPLSLLLIALCFIGFFYCATTWRNRWLSIRIAAAISSCRIRPSPGTGQRGNTGGCGRRR